ncbi:MAG: flavodoxin [Anaerolineae bacterium]|nr:flavodoxin [Anaerolineae bacterium]
MDGQVLVAYATKHGATEGIADKVGQSLRDNGLKAEVIPVGQIGDLHPYEAVVLGSAVYAGQWRNEAVAFLKAHGHTLAERPVWLFSTGPTGEGEPVELTKGWRFPEAQQAMADRIQPRDIALFHGALDMQKLNLAEKLIVKAVKAPAGDFRNWEAITTWAQSIAAELSQSEQGLEQSET